MLKVKVKVKLLLFTARRHIRGVAVGPAAALILSLGARWRSVVSLKPCPLYPSRKYRRYTPNRRRVCPKAGLVLSWNRRISRLCRHSKPRSSIPWPSHYTIPIPIKIQLFTCVFVSVDLRKCCTKTPHWHSRKPDEQNFGQDKKKTFKMALHVTTVDRLAEFHSEFIVHPSCHDAKVNH